MANLILDRLDEIGMTTNQLSCLSGVKNSHLNQIQNDITRKPGRDILIRIGLGLSWGVGGINNLLGKYGQEDLSEADVSFFMRAIEARETRSGYNAIHPGGFNFEIVIMSVEKIMGDIRLVTPIPHVVFRDFENYFSSDQVPAGEKKDAVYKEIRKFLFNQRVKMFEKNIAAHKVRHLICADCLDEYVGNKSGSNGGDLVGEFNAIFKGLCHENYELGIISRCPSFKFHVRQPDGRHKKPIVVFGGIPKHVPARQSEKETDETGALLGFISDSKALHRYFEIEFDRLSGFAIGDCSDKQRLVAYLIGLLEKHGVKGGWET